LEELVHETFGRYEWKEEETLCILTDPIEIKRGGLLKPDTENPSYGRMTDDDCTAMWLPLEDEYGGKGAITLHDLFKQIDELLRYGEAIEPRSGIIQLI
jgi:hypothetical protein